MAFWTYVKPLANTFLGLTCLLLLSGCFIKAELSKPSAGVLPSSNVVPSGPLKVIRSSPVGSQPVSYANDNGTVYFNALVPGTDVISYLTDGTTIGTTSIASVNSLLPSDAKYIGTLGSVRLFYSNLDGNLWRSDGTTAGTYALIATSDPMQMYMAPWMKLDASGTIGWWLDVNNQEILQTNGTVAGTFRTNFGFFAVNWGTVPNGAVITQQNKTGTPWTIDVSLFDFATRTVSFVAALPDRDAGRGTDYQDGSSRYYFPVHQWGVGNYLAYTDGTAAGTVELNTGVHMDGVLAPVGKLGTKVIYLGQPSGGTKAYKFFVTEGTSAADWTEIKDTGYNFMTNAWAVDFIRQVGSKFVVRFYDANAPDTASLGGVWVTDGTAGGTSKLGEVALDDPANIIFGGSTFQAFVFNNAVYFQGYDSTNGLELWKTDGTSAPAVFADLNPGLASGLPVGVDTYLPINAGVTPSYFVLPIKTATNGIEPFISDGTVAGTKLLKDLQSGTASSLGGDNGTEYDFQALGNKVIFAATTESYGNEYWVTDGTAAGTKILASLNSAPGPTDMSKLQVLNGKIYFSATNGQTGVEPWVSDGTPEGTHLILDIDASSATSRPSQFVNFNGSTYFLAVSDTTLGDNKTSLWKTDGSAAGTINLATQKLTSSSTIESFNGGLFMVGTDTTNGREPWISDGTPSGTQVLRDIAVGTGHSMNSNVDWVFNWNGKLLFAPNRGGAVKNDPWLTDGTSAGTNLIANLNATGGGKPKGGRGTSQAFYFWAKDATAGYELFKTDGTSGNTALVKDINPGITDSMVYASSFYGDVHDRVIFFANDGTNGGELWVSDGTAAGTLLLKDISPGSADTQVLAATQDAGFVYLLLQPATDNWQLWKTDGTPAGTELVRDFTDGEEADADATNLDMISMNGYLFFTMCEVDHGCELWRSDGTSAGTALYWDATEGATGTKPRSFVQLNGGLYFIGGYQGGGETVWKVDPLIAPSF